MPRSVLNDLIMFNAVIKYKICLSLIMFFASSGITSAQSDILQHQNYAERKPYFDSLEAYYNTMDSAGAIKAIDAMIKWAKKNNSNELMYHFRLLRYKRETINYRGDDIDSEILEMVKQVEKQGYKKVAAEWYHILGERYWSNNDRAKGLEFALTAYNIYRYFSLTEFPNKIDFQHILATRYYAFGDYAKAKKYLLDLKTTNTDDIHNILRGGYYNTFALTYLRLGQYDSAMYCFKNLYYQTQTSDPAMAELSAGNLGFTFFTLKEYDSAIIWMLRERELDEKYHVILRHNLAMSSIRLAEIYTFKNKLKEAEENILLAADYFKSEKDYDDKDLAIFYKIYSSLKAHQGQMNAAYLYMDSARMHTDSFYTKNNQAVLVEAEHKIYDANKKLELEKLVHSKETNIMLRNMALVIVSLLSIIALLLINKKRLQHKQKIETSEMELANAEKQLQRFTKNIHEKNKLIEQFTTDIERLQYEQTQIVENNNLVQLQQSTILTDDEWDEFRSMFEKVHGGFLNRLKTKFPDITPAETRYMALSKLNLDNKEMANVLGIGVNAVRNNKFRLRKKLNIGDDENFEAIINSI